MRDRSAADAGASERLYSEPGNDDLFEPIFYIQDLRIGDYLKEIGRSDEILIVRVVGIRRNQQRDFIATGAECTCRFSFLREASIE
jgi:hypothetical protein